MIKKRVFLASSAQLKDERREFENLIGLRNEVLVNRDAFLELVVWENFLDAVSPTRKQDEYNEAIRQSDIFVMIFATKVGPYTQEEFDTAFKHFKATGRPLIYTYFKDVQINLGDVNQNDVMSLWAFQKQLDGLGHFYNRYTNTDGLKFHFTQQLEMLEGNGFLQNESRPDEAAPVVEIIDTVLTDYGNAKEAKSIVAQYVRSLAADLSGLRLGDIDASADPTSQTPLELADIYVPLDTTLRIPKHSTLAQSLEPGPRPYDPNTNSPADESEAEGAGKRSVTTLEALAQHPDLTVLGKPGSGKSTFGSHVLLTLTRAWMGDSEALRTLGADWTHGALLPLRVVLRRFAEQLADDKPVSAADVWTFIGREISASGRGLSDDTLRYVQRIAFNHGALILLDGLDECGTPARQELVLKAVNEFKQSAGRACRFVTTARPFAWPGGAVPAKGVYELADLTDEQIDSFIDGWYRAAVARKWLPPGEAHAKIDDLVQARKRGDLKPLMQNPLLLTLMATQHTNRGWLPNDRVDLYKESVDLLMLRWNRRIGADKALLDKLSIPDLKLSNVREVLEELAFTLHERDVGSEAAGDIKEGPLVGAFNKLLKSKDKADIVVDYIEKRAGLLLAKGEKDNERHFTFPHRTFREYLAACHLAAKQEYPTECVRLARSAPENWQVVLSMAASLAGAERGASAADGLIYRDSIDAFRRRQEPNALDWTCAGLAATQLLEIGLSAVRKDPSTEAIARRVAGWLAASLSVHVPGPSALHR